MEGAVEYRSPKLSPDRYAQAQLHAAAWILCFLIAALALGWSGLQ